MRSRPLDERDKACKRPNDRGAIAQEWNAKLEPIRRTEDRDTAKALRQLRRDVKAWESAAEDEAA
ncbi:MAG: hypothetical protein M3P18_01165 [Actinomycetota bacterium]|nr:hypothetical protein [Actinomycetota bacterium]